MPIHYFDVFGCDIVNYTFLQWAINNQNQNTFIYPKGKLYS